MIYNIKHLAGALLLNLLGFISAIAAIIALSYLPQISIFVFATVFLTCLFAFGTVAVRILLSDCLSRRPWREAFAIEGISLVFGAALNYAVLASGTAWTGIDDIWIVIFSAIVCACVLVIGGKMYLSSLISRPSRRFYIGVILWQSFGGILAMGLIAYFFWTWSWLI